MGAPLSDLCPDAEQERSARPVTPAPTPSSASATRRRTAAGRRRRWVVATTLVLAIGAGGTMAYAHEQRGRAERLEAAQQEAAVTRGDLLEDLDVADSALRSTLTTARDVLAGTDPDTADTPETERALANAGVAEGDLEALRLAVAEAQALLDAPVDVLVTPRAQEGARVDVPTGTTPAATELDASGTALATAVETVRGARVTVAAQQVLTVLPAAEARLASWEPIVADPASLADLRDAVAAGAAVRDGVGTTDPVELRALAGSIESATAAHAEVVTDGVGPTTIGGVPLVNKAVPLPAGYDPGMLPEVSAAFEAMRAQAATEGVTLFIHSGYRSYTDQRVTYDGWAALHGEETADRFSSRPGHSEHQSGLSLDVNAASHTFAGTPEAAWVAANAHRFGFVVRFPEGKEAVTGYMYEPWHLRHVGTELAQELVAAGTTLEEHLGVRADYLPEGA